MDNYEKVELTNMCMIYDGDGNVVVQDKVNRRWGGVTFPGGHVEKGESFVDSVIREVKEETGLDIKNPKICGIKWWKTDDDTRYIVLFYKTDEFSGTLKSSDEGRVFRAKLEDLGKMKLAPSFDVMLKVFTDDNIQEHIQIEENGEWISVLR